jgi:hypothetical protein
MRELTELTEQERAIIARSDAGETRRAICKALGVTPSDVQRAEWAGMRDARVRQLLAECPDSIEAMVWIDELSGYAAEAMGRHHWYHDGPGPKRMSEVAALGRLYVSHIKGIGPKGLASIDHVLEMLGIAWAPIDRMPKAKPRKVEQQQPNESLDQAVLLIGRLQVEKEDLRQRLERLERRYVASLPGADEDDAADSSEDLETAGNLVCMPGVRLADVLPKNGGAA